MEVDLRALYWSVLDNAMVKDTGVVNIHGKQYTTVAKRVQDFRETYERGYSIVTELVSADADIVIMKAYIRDTESRKVIATGYAEEQRTSSQINRTSALENAETSAIGRALAAFGLAGSEYASADEVAQAISQQPAPAPSAPRSSSPPASDKQKLLITELLEQIRVERDDMKGYIIETYGVEYPLTVEGASFVIDQLMTDKSKPSRTPSA